MKIVFSMGEVFQEVKFWRWLMNIRTLKVLVFRQFFQKIMARHWERVEVYIQAFRISSKKKFKKPVIPLFLKSAVFDCFYARVLRYGNRTRQMKNASLSQAGGVVGHRRRHHRRYHGDDDDNVLPPDTPDDDDAHCVPRSSRSS
jgi:hypothetical protein